MVKILFDPRNAKPFPISRTKIEEFVQCPRCFYLNVKLGVGRPSGPPFTLNSAVDALLKKEFDLHRAEGTAHPLMDEYGIDAVPYRTEKMAEWRNTFKGVRFVHPQTNFDVFGAVDDVWVNRQNHLIVVDYKATSTSAEITLEGGRFKDGYKREVEVYQWLLRKNGFTVSDTAYFVYVNGRKDREAFHGTLEFTIQVIPHKGSDAWIEPTLRAIHDTLKRDALPEPAPACDFCAYRASALRVGA